jgi:hypothetical protein
VASLGVVALWFVPLMLSMVVYAALSRMTPALARAVKRPQRLQHPRSTISRAA